MAVRKSSNWKCSAGMYELSSGRLNTKRDEPSGFFPEKKGREEPGCGVRAEDHSLPGYKLGNSCLEVAVGSRCGGSWWGRRGSLLRH